MFDPFDIITTTSRNFCFIKSRLELIIISNNQRIKNPQLSLTGQLNAQASLFDTNHSNQHRPIIDYIYIFF